MREDAPLAAVESDSLHCYRCDHVYAHIGSDPHPGRCPNCGSRAVPPAGEIQVEPIVPISLSDGTEVTAEEYPVRGSDGTDRNFQYHTSVEEQDAERAVVSLRTVSVDGEQPLDTVTALGTDLVPRETLSTALAEVLEVESVELRP